jgi:hypothetical protein
LKITEWTALRALLNHDVLCNQVRGELCALAVDPHQSTLRLERWIQREREYHVLLEEAVNVLSLANFVDSAEFACWNCTQRNAFRKPFHALFLATSDVPRRTKELLDLLRMSIESVRSFLAVPRRYRTREGATVPLELLTELSMGISALSKEPTYQGLGLWNRIEAGQ